MDMLHDLIVVPGLAKRECLVSILSGLELLEIGLWSLWRHHLNWEDFNDRIGLCKIGRCASASSQVASISERQVDVALAFLETENAMDYSKDRGDSIGKIEVFNSVLPQQM